MTLSTTSLSAPPVELQTLPSLWQHQAHADLKWILDSAPLFEGPDGLCELASIHGKVNSVPITSLTSPLKTPPSSRVGLYFESLLFPWLIQGLHLELEAHHLQVFDNGRTVGEIDFSVRDPQGMRWRLESTIKFYLHYPNSNSTEGSSFIGPDPRDSFERKYAHLTERQLRLWVPELGQPDHALPIARGILFYHFNDRHNPQRPAKANPKHIRGLWMKASEWAGFCDLSSGVERVINLPKPFWISGISNPGLTSRELTLTEATNALKAHFSCSRTALMLSLQQSTDKGYCEKWRCIIVADTWPNCDLRS